MSRLSEGQQRSLLVLASPLPKSDRGEFYRRVGVAVAALPSPLGDGQVYKIGVAIQRELLGQPALDGRDL